MICRRLKSPVRYRCGGRLKCGRNACGRVVAPNSPAAMQKAQIKLYAPLYHVHSFLSPQFLCDLLLVTVKMLEKSFPYLKLVEEPRSLQCVVVSSKYTRRKLGSATVRYINTLHKGHRVTVTSRRGGYVPYC
jgi:hypothetical protein